jgi:hypothetical protein
VDENAEFGIPEPLGAFISRQGFPCGLVHLRLRFPWNADSQHEKQGGFCEKLHEL